MKSRLVKTIIASICIASMIAPMNAYAFGGYAHWNMATKVAKDKGMRSTVANYYKSGCLLADIGRVNWDKKYTTSDSKAFGDKMLARARQSKVYAYIAFASGWLDHVTQDSKGSLAKISGGPSNGYIKYGWVDEYLRDVEGMRSPINGTSSIYFDYWWIKETYKMTDNFQPTDSQIDNEIRTMYNVLILSNLSGWSSSEKTSIKNELNRTAGLCFGRIVRYQSRKPMDLYTN